MRPLLPALLALLLAAAAPKAAPSLLPEEQKAAKGYAAAREKLGTWCVQKGFLEDGKAALEEAFLWDGRNEKTLKALKALPEEFPPPPTDEKLLAELKTRKETLATEQSKAFAKLALQAAKGKAWVAARRYAAIARKLKEDVPGLEPVDKALSGEGAGALKALDAETEEAKSGHVLRPETPECGMEYVLKLPRDHDPARRCPLYIHAHGSGGNAKESIQALESFRSEGFAILAPTCHSSWNQDKRDPGVECRQILQIVDRLATEIGIDPERVFVDGHSGGGYVAYTMIDKHRDRLRGVIPIAANFYVGVGKAPKPDPFPVYVIKGEKDEYNASMLDAQIAGALETLKRGQFTNVRFEIIPGMTHTGIHTCEDERLAWIREVLAFKAPPK